MKICVLFIGDSIIDVGRDCLEVMDLGKGYLFLIVGKLIL